jgi:uncharacterized protein (TIGR03435 family)
MNRMILLAGLLIPGLASAQSSSTGGAPDRFEIEVATVKQNKNGGGQNIQLTPGGQINITNIPLRTLIRMAYGSDAIQTMGQVVGGPGWIDTERFDIVAKTTVPPSPRADIFPVMVRSVLEDRFQIKVHSEKREVPIYAIVLANKDGRLGTSLKPSDGKCYSQDNPPPPNTPFNPSTFCSVRGGAGDMTYTGQTIQAIGRNLANYPVIGRPVIDRTGLQGQYDLHIVFVPAFIDSPNGPPVANPAADSGPNLFTALVEQAGLRLQGERGAAEFLVIDRVERPTEN